MAEKFGFESFTLDIIMKANCQKKSCRSRFKSQFCGVLVAHLAHQNTQHAREKCGRDVMLDLLLSMTVKSITRSYTITNQLTIANDAVFDSMGTLPVFAPPRPQVAPARTPADNHLLAGARTSVCLQDGKLT